MPDPQTTTTDARTPFSFGQSVAEPHDALTWYPDGAEGAVHVAVPAPFLLTVDENTRVKFPIGTYAVPARVRVSRQVLSPADDPTKPPVMRTVERIDELGGRDEASMHWYLRANGVKHTGQFAMPPQATGEALPVAAAQVATSSSAITVESVIDELIARGWTPPKPKRAKRGA